MEREMTTKLTPRLAGTLALVGAIIWLVVAAASLLATNISGDDWEGPYLMMSILAFAAAICTTVAIFGVLQRAGAGRGWLSVAMLFAILGTLALGLVLWAWIVGGALFAIAALLTVLRLRAKGLGSAPLQWLLVVAWPIGFGIAVLLEKLEVGPMDSYGDYRLAFDVGFSIGCVLFAAGLAAHGLWLRREQMMKAVDK